MSSEYLMYLRKSRADLDAEARGEGETLKRHENMLLELAAKMNIHIPDEYIYREVVSGETIAARPSMQELLSEIEKGTTAGVFVVEVERLARGDTIDQGVVAQAFKYTNTKIITPMKTYDPANEYDEEYFEFGLFMSRREYKTITRRIQRGRIASVKEGKYISSVAPYGYNRVKIKNDKGYTLEINPDQAMVIRMIYELYTVGELQDNGTYEKLGTVRIARKLDSLGLKPLIKDTWSRASIQDILKNPVYIGKIRWSYRKEVKTVQNNEVVVTRPNSDDYILVEGLHEAIIDIETFNKAQDILSKRVHPSVPGNSSLKNPLSGIVYCRKCGSMLTRLAKTKKTPYDAMKCPNRYCDNVSSPLYLIENVIIDELSKWLKDFKVKWKYEKKDKPYSNLIKEKETILKQYDSQLEKLHDQRDKTYTLLEQGIYSTEVFTERSNKVSNQIKDIEQATIKIKKEIKKLHEQANRNDVFIPKVEHLLSVYWDIETAIAKNEALKEILERVEYIKTEPNKKGNRDNTNFHVDLYPKVIKF